MTESAAVYLICGPLCGGKTTYAEALCRETGAVPLSADDLMLALFGPDAGEAHDRLARGARAYLLDLAVRLARRGTPAVLDWGFWTRPMREEVLDRLRREGIPASLHRLDVPEDVWRRRIEGRNLAVREGRARAYPVDEGLLTKFLSLYDPPPDSECDRVVTAS